jgi:superfamily I DNA/RNA helicase
MQATKEQQYICELTAIDKNLLIQALAGTGKTTTGKFIANHLPNKTCLSIFFNKKNADEGMAQVDRPNNMFYSTIHSLCYKQVMNAGFKSKLNNFLLFEDIDTSLLKKLLLNEEAYGKGEYNKELGKLQRIILDCIKWWQQSDSKDLFDFVVHSHPTNLGYKTDFSKTSSIEELDLVIITDEDEKNKHCEYLAKTCCMLWNNMIEPSLTAKITHDTYVKLFQLQGLTFRDVYDVSNKMFLSLDLLILDECQDSSAVTLSIFNNQTHLQRIACGDKNQNLYSWRGAKNDFSSFDTWNKATLTESFRFGQDIADLANKVLALPAMETKLKLIGRGTDKGTNQTAILCRTNATVLQTVFTKLLLGEKVACVSKFNEMESMMYHVFAVLNEQEPKFPVASLKSFDTKDKMWQAIESNQELGQVYKLAKMISDAKGGLFTGLKYLKDNLVSKEKADYIVSTIHASKGLGFTNVVIADDFLTPIMLEGIPYYDDAIEDLLVDRVMLSMCYVAITRAIETVTLPWYLEGLL